MKIIAEVKTHSPFGWESLKSWDELFEIADRVGDIISIHTDPRWHGSFDLISKARSLTTKPILAKGIHKKDNDIKRALELGANYVLVVGRIPKINIEYCLIEPSSIEELSHLDPTIKAVWNSRDLSSGGLKKEAFADARKVFSGWLCQASNIHTLSDVSPGADAILVGTNLPTFAKSLNAAIET